MQISTHRHGNTTTLRIRRPRTRINWRLVIGATLLWFAAIAAMRWGR